jgi:hypothetical protein
MRFSSIIALSLVGSAFGAPAPMRLERDGKATTPYELDARNVVERQSGVCRISIAYMRFTHSFACSLEAACISALNLISLALV